MSVVAVEVANGCACVKACVRQERERGEEKG